MTSDGERIDRVEREVDRLARNAQEDRREIIAGQGALKYAIGLVGDRVDTLDRKVDAVDRKVDAFRAEVNDRFAEVNATLAEIMRRLPDRTD